MLRFRGSGYYDLESISNQNGLVDQEPKWTKEEMDSGDLSSGSKTKRKKSKAALEAHARSEKRRRKRINSHIDTLRQLFPNLLKNHKASVLTEMVRLVKELKKTVDDVLQRQDGDMGSASVFLPGEKDEATVSSCDGREGNMVKATVCCEDRPTLNRELTKAVRAVRGTVVRAEMATIGGRTKVVVVVQWKEGGGGDGDVGSLRRALKAILNNWALGCNGFPTHVLPSSKWSGLGHQGLPGTKWTRSISK